MHPSDDTDTFFFVVSCFEHCFYFFRRVGSSFIYYFHRQFAAGIQTCYHFVTVCVYCDNCIASVKELSSGYEPYFILIKCVHSDFMFLIGWIFVFMLFFLSVISVRTVLAAEVFFYQQRVHGQIRIDSVSNAGHFGNLLHDYGIVNSIVCILTP